MSWQTLATLGKLLVVVVVIIDLSGVTESIKKAIRRYLHIRGEVSIKPFDCSFCMFHWLGLGVLLFYGQLTLGSYMCVCIGCLLTSPTALLLTSIIDLLEKFISWTQRKG